ncbi:MAG: hypothetical protein LBR83_03710, partial [Clostridiales bacterium]|nr:hypothetical protein [Clostridiales bacterium]
MFNTQTIRSSNRMTGVLLNQKSRVQKKYFSLMLVPSYSTGKTRSVRIPQRAFYIALAVVFVISATILAVYLRSNHFMRVAEEINTSRVQLLEEFNELQQESANLQNKYVDDSNHLKSQLTDEQNRFQTEKNRQRQDYQSTLDGLQEQVDDLERQLRDLDAARQAIVDQLSAKGYIPPVQSILTEMSDSQAVLLSARGDVQIRSDERFTSVKTTEEDLRDYFLLLTAKLEAETQCFAELQAYAQEISPYAKNYPT